MTLDSHVVATPSIAFAAAAAITPSASHDTRTALRSGRARSMISRRRNGDATPVTPCSVATSTRLATHQRYGANSRATRRTGRPSGGSAANSAGDAEVASDEAGALTARPAPA